MNTHIMILATKFLSDIKEYGKDSAGKIECESNYKKEVMLDLIEILGGRSVTAKVLHDLIEEERTNPDKTMYYRPGDILDAHGISYIRKANQDPQNLLQLGRFYYHPVLQVTPAPPVLVIEDDGTMTASYESEVFFLEIKDTFTRKDLVHYFYTKMNKQVPEGMIARDIGAFDHMLRFWDIDFILYLIDEAFAQSIDKGSRMPRTPLDIQHFEVETLPVYEARKQICFEEGIDRVLPRAIT